MPPRCRGKKPDRNYLTLNSRPFVGRGLRWTKHQQLEGLTMLKDMLKDWHDFDGAEHAIAVSLGLMPDDWEWVLNNAKWVLWSNNPFGNMLSDMLTALVTQGVLEENEDQQFRYNPSFVPPWERQKS